MPRDFSPQHNSYTWKGSQRPISLCPFHGTFSFPARSLQEFATVLRNLEDERIRMVSTAGLLLLPYSVIMSRDLLSEELGLSPASTT